MDSLPFVREIDSDLPVTSILASSPSFTVGSPAIAAPPAVLPAVFPAAPVVAPAPGAVPVPAGAPALAEAPPAAPAPAAPDGTTGMLKFFRSSTVVTLPSTTTAFCESSIVKSPSGTRREEPWTIPFMVSSVSPYCFSLSWLNFSVTSLTYCPAICTEATPSTSSRAGRISFSAMRVRLSRSEELLSDKLSEMTGKELRLNREICGFCTLSGRATSFSASRTAAVALSRFVP
ncbi:hypothetical protein D3C75_612410 [compost metagenome]